MRELLNAEPVPNELEGNFKAEYDVYPATGPEMDTSCTRPLPARSLLVPLKKGICSLIVFNSE